MIWDVDPRNGCTELRTPEGGYCCAECGIPGRAYCSGSLVCTRCKCYVTRHGDKGCYGWCLDPFLGGVAPVCNSCARGSEL